MAHLNHYLIKAYDNYPYDLEETIESLNYALSYEPNNPFALGLFARVHADVYEDYDTAIQYFESALAENVKLTSIYGHYLLVLIHHEDYKKALKFIDYALTVKGADKGMLYARQVLIYECQQKFKRALKTIKKAKKHTYNTNHMDYLNEFKKRIKQKIRTTKPKKKQKKSKSAK